MCCRRCRGREGKDTGGEREGRIVDPLLFSRVCSLNDRFVNVVSFVSCECSDDL